MEYCSTMKKKEIQPLTTWMELEGIILSEISQRKTNAVSSQLYVETLKRQTHRSRA